MKNIFKNEFKLTIISIAGNLLFSIGVNFFLVPLGFYSGGFLGIGQVIRTILIDHLSLPIENVDIAGIIYYIINIPLFIIAYHSISKKFFFRTLISVTAQTFFLTLIPMPESPVITDSLTSALIGGIIAGFGTGISLSAGGSGGGQDILAVYIMKKKSGISVGKISIIINAAVFAVCLLLYDLSVVIYSLIYVAADSIVTDKFYKQSVLMKAVIITSSDKITAEITQRFQRSATIIKGNGAYSGKQFNVIYTVVSKSEAFSLLEFTRSCDKNAFITLSEVKYVYGNFEPHLI